ncbi:MAG: FAD-binding oxidoreductase [Planctomycetota bacterium]
MSLWQRGRADEIETTVAIVGGGVCGLSAALECEARGVDAVIVERERVGSGASGRNAGYLMRGMAESYAVACAVYGRERARAVWAWSEANLADLRELGVDAAAGFESRASCLVALDGDEERELRRSASMMAEDGFDTSLVEPTRDSDALWRSGRARVGLVNPGDAVCDPVALLAALRSRLERTRVIESREVFAVEADAGRVSVRGRGLCVRAERVLVAANAWIGDLVPTLRGVIEPKRGQMLAARPLEPTPLEFAYYLNRGDEYIRSGPGGVVLVGGCRRFEPEHESGDRGGVHPAVQDRLEGYLRELVADRYEVVARWSGVMGFSPNGLPIVGPTIDDERVWVCGGFTGHGMSIGHLAGRRAAAAMLGVSERPALFDTPTDHCPDHSGASSR